MNLLIADDEPLILAGTKSMISWEDHDIQIVGTAANGAIAYDMILKYSPEIVITDIKMPVMSGLELAKKCKEEHRFLPVFIILTGYEEFEFARQALAYQVVDYLVKAKLTQESLENAVRNAAEKVRELQGFAQLSQNPTDGTTHLCGSFASSNKDYKTHIVANVKKYINEHVDEKLTLNKVAEVFNISSNYLSILFSKCNDIGFIDYINQSKVAAAKEMMRTGHLKIYEIADVLGFESAFYFSRVFKKVTGIPPRDYINIC